MLEVTKPLSVKLQSESQDIHHAMEGVMDAVNVLQQLRDDEPAYDRIFQKYGLAQLFINKDLMLNHDDVIDEFSKENRRLSFH